VVTTGCVGEWQDEEKKIGEAGARTEILGNRELNWFRRFSVRDDALSNQSNRFHSVLHLHD